MEKHLKQATEAYKDNEQEVSAISKTDAEIIVELRQILKKLGETSLQHILDEWKVLPDGQIRDLLIDYGLNYKPKKEAKKGKKNGFMKNFVIFDSITLDIYFITSIGRKKTFNYLKEAYDYILVINEFTSEQSLYHNLSIRYETEQELDEKYALLHEALLSTETINFY